MSFADSEPDNPYKYNGKELYEDHGLDWYDYGARMYDPQIGRWHVVDPLASDFPSWTPYHFAHNNPIVLIDPTGMSADWFQNQLTGEVYYNSDMRKGDESQLGDNWSHLGENGMFSDGTPMTSDVALLAQNKSLTNIEPNADGSISSTGYMKADRAKGFMDEQGYDFNPVQQTIYEKTSETAAAGPGSKTFTFQIGEVATITERSRYMKDNNKAIGKIPLTGTETNGIKSFPFTTSVARYEITYTDKWYIKAANTAVSFSRKMSGKHDYRNKRNYGNWNQYPGNVKLINTFRENYGTK